MKPVAVLGSAVTALLLLNTGLANASTAGPRAYSVLTAQHRTCDTTTKLCRYAKDIRVYNTNPIRLPLSDKLALRYTVEPLVAKHVGSDANTRSWRRLPLIDGFVAKGLIYGDRRARWSVLVDGQYGDTVIIHIRGTYTKLGR